MFHTVLFTHTDLDGISARVIFQLAYDYYRKGIDYEVYMCENATLDDTVHSVAFDPNLSSPSYTTIYFADLCAKPETLQQLKNAGYNVLIFDHHPTNFPALQVYPDAVIKPENEMGVKQCGTSLLYQYFCSLNPSDPRIKYFISKGNQKLLSQFVENVRLYDTYTFKETNDMKPRHLQSLSFMLGTERFVDRYVKRIKSEDSTYQLIDENDMDFITAKLEMEQRAIDNFTEDDVYPVNVRGYRCALVIHTRGAGISELAFQFLTKHPEFDIMIGFSAVGDGKFEIRTIRDDINVGEEIAKPCGGGGHPKAAGAPFSSDDKLRFVDFLVRILDPDQFTNNGNDGLITEDSPWFI